MAVMISGGGIGICRKKPMRLCRPARPQRLGQRDQVIIMHPDDVVGLQHLGQLVGEMLIDPQIAAMRSRRENSARSSR